MSKESNIKNLEQFIASVVEIECTKCGVEAWVSVTDPEEDAYSEGWRATDKHSYCPKCAKKYLKKSNQ